MRVIRLKNLYPKVKISYTYIIQSGNNTNFKNIHTSNPYTYMYPTSCLVNKLNNNIVLYACFVLFFVTCVFMTTKT